MGLARRGRATPSPTGCLVRSRSSRSALALLCSFALILSACGDDLVGSGDGEAGEAGEANEADQGGGAAEEAREAEGALQADEPEGAAPRDLKVRRGLGSMTARVPGTTDVISGVRLDAHRVRVTIQDGFSRTEIEEELFNETDRVLEGRYVFPIPPGATVTRLGLWVGANLVEGEIVERRRAAQIFRSIVEPKVRLRDPALLEWVRGGEVSLKIFPIPARSARKVVLAYDEALPIRGGKLRYTHPLSLGAERATVIGDFSVSVRLAKATGEARAITSPGWTSRAPDGDATRIEIHERDFVPDRDFVAEVAAPLSTAAPRVILSGIESHGGGEHRFFTTSIALPLEGAARALDRVIVLDTSDSQSPETIDAEARATRAVVQSLQRGERFAVLACSTRCTSFPAVGLGSSSSDERAGLDAFLAALRPGGASDLSASIARGALRLEHGGQVVVLHDGKPSAGELSPDAIAERVLPPLSVQGAEMRFVGVGRSVDDVALQALARAVDASYEPLAGDASLEARTRRLAHDLARPVLTNARIELPEGYANVVPATWPRLIPGEPIRVFGTLDGEPGGGVARVIGELDGETIDIPVRLSVDTDAPPNPLVSKLWADRAIAELEVDTDGASRARVVALSKDFHVLSRQTSLLVLENEQMFAEFGVKRTTLKAADQADHGFGGLDVTESAPERAALGWDAGDTSAPLQDAGGQGFGAGQGRLSGSHRTKAPQIRMGMTSVSGRLPPEIVQRVVRQQFGRFRACYEIGLRRNPQLAGRVVTRFVIGHDGLVGSSADSGSDLPDVEVVACVVRGFRALQFPQPEGGIVTVTYPIVFAGDGTAPTRPVAEWPMPSLTPSPARTRPQYEIDAEAAQAARARARRSEPRVKMIVEHSPGTDAWRMGRESDIAALERGLTAVPESRQKRARFVHALLGNGRWDRARDEAARFVELDPDLALARELLAQAASATDNRVQALDALEALTEAEPRSTDAHLRAARALEAAGEVERACAHQRTLAELQPSPAMNALAAACWNTVLDPSPDMAKVAEARTLATKPPSAAPFTATVTCEDASVSCPGVAILTPAGRVISRAAPWQATPIDGGVALSVASAGTYRTVLLGGDPRVRGKVTVRAYGTAREIAFGPSDPRTALVTRIEEQWLPRRWRD